MAETSCPRVGRLFGGCKFRPRYDSELDDIEDPPVSKTYVGDICVQCGKFALRPKDAVKR